jgi:hypothetical protein
MRSRVGVWRAGVSTPSALGRPDQPGGSQARSAAPFTTPAKSGLILSVLMLLAMGIAVPLGILYFLVRFVKWAWTD